MAPLNQHKLQSRRGATMLIALLYVLVAVMVGAVVLTTAYTNLGRVRGGREEQQNYHTVASALELIRDKLEGRTCRAAYVGTELVRWHPAVLDADGEVLQPPYSEPPVYHCLPAVNKTGIDGVVSSPSVTMEDGSSPPLGGVSYDGGEEVFFPRDMASYLFYHNSGRPELDAFSPPDFSRELTLQMRMAGQKEESPSARGTIRMVEEEWNSSLGLGRYSLVVTLEACRDGEPQGYTSTLILPASTRSGSEPVGETVGWSGGAQETTAYREHYTEITWGEPKIVKGALT